MHRHHQSISRRHTKAPREQSKSIKNSLLSSRSRSLLAQQCFSATYEPLFLVRSCALGVEKQRTGLKLGSGSEPALERLWWKRGVCVVLCSPVRCVWWCSRVVNLPHTTFPPHPEYQLSLGWWCVWSNVRRSPGILSASLSSHGSTDRKRRNQHLLAFTVVSAAYTHFQNLTSFFIFL